MPDVTSILPTAARLIALVVFCSQAAATPAPDSDEDSRPRDVRYSEHIRPILSDRCFHCHGPDGGSRKASLQLHDRDSVIADRGGYAVIVPGNLHDSEIWRRITSTDPDEMMPPPESGKAPLTADERALLASWIEDGAAYEGHWAFAAPQRAIPPVTQDTNWSASEFDAFILDRLEREGIAPSPPADRATLLRRAFLDLTGLPPTLEELDDFLTDEHPLAYERWIDRLLNEEPYRSRYAEHWTATWLDAARYGDTSGIHTDNGRQNCQHERNNNNGN